MLVYADNIGFFVKIDVVCLSTLVLLKTDVVGYKTISIFNKNDH